MGRHTDSHLVNYYPSTQAQIILPGSRYYERRSHGLMGSWDEDYSYLLVAPVDDVPVDLNRTHVETMIYFEINTATEGHGEARLPGVKVANAEHRRQLRAVDIHFLIGETKQCVPEGLEPWPIVRIVLDRDSTEDVVDCGIDCATPCRAGKIILTQMK